MEVVLICVLNQAAEVEMLQHLIGQAVDKEAREEEVNAKRILCCRARIALTRQVPPLCLRYEFHILSG